MLKKAFSTLILAALSVSAVDLPRQTPEFQMNYNSGKQVLLTSYRGKVILAEFLFTTCPHCQHTAQLFSKLQDAYGARGFQALGVAFNEMANMLVPDFIKDYRPSFPVGFADRDRVMNYLGLSPAERFVVPQIVLIDKRGVIRFQSPPLGDPNLQDEKFLRQRIEELLDGKIPAPYKPAPAK